MTKRYILHPVQALVALIALSSAHGIAQAAEESPSAAEALALDPPQWEFGNYELRLGGFAGGSNAFFFQPQEQGLNASGEVRANLRFQRTFDNGVVAGIRSDMFVLHDKLTRDHYDSDFLERLFLFAQTGFGRIEVGQQDGAAATIGLTGPVVDDQVTLENRRISLFADPTTGRDFGRFFVPVTNVYSTSNYAKFNYISPRLFGIQVGASFTPQAVRSPLPFTGNPSDGMGAQKNIWELAAGYTGYFSNLAVGLSAGVAHGYLRNDSPDYSDLTDWALGAQLAYTLMDVKLSLGGAYRDSNAYLLHVADVGRNGDTRTAHLSGMVEKGSWLLGVEYSNGDAHGPVDYRILGKQVTAGYRVNSNLQFSAGWQWYDYRRDIGTFYNSRRSIAMNAGFLTLGYAL